MSHPEGCSQGCRTSGPASHLSPKGELLRMRKLGGRKALFVCSQSGSGTAI